MDLTKITKYLGGLITLLVVVFAVLFVAWFVPLPILTDLANTVFGFIGLGS